MKKHFLLALMMAALLLSACQAAATPTITQEPTVPSAPGEPYPAPNDLEPGDPMDIYPAPNQDSGQALFNFYPPAQDDARMQRGNFFFEAATLRPRGSEPGTADLFVEGTLPTPCNQVRVNVNAPDANNRIVVELYSVSDPDMMCIQVIEPFAGQVATLGGYPTGTYPVVIGDQTVGELVVP
jgi:hypothetical protein